MPSGKGGGGTCPSVCTSMMESFEYANGGLAISDVMFLSPSVVSQETTWNTLVYLCNPSVSQVPGLVLKSACLLSEMAGVRQGRHDHWTQQAAEVRFQGQPVWQ